MHHYAFHIKDYQADTAHLSNEEDLCYRRLLDHYYDTENPIPKETQWVARRLRVGSESVTAVLKEFFIETDLGWIQARCQAEIAHYLNNAEKNRTNGKLGGRPKKTQWDASGNRVATQLKANHEPVTSNHEPINSKALSTLQAKIDDTPPEIPEGQKQVVLKNGKARFQGDAEIILQFLNERTGSRYRPTAVNLEMIAERLKEGASVPDCRAVIIRKSKEWAGTEMDKYLRPATLFNRTKFSQYVGEVPK